MFHHRFFAAATPLKNICIPCGPTWRRPPRRACDFATHFHPNPTFEQASDFHLDRAAALLPHRFSRAPTSAGATSYAACTHERFVYAYVTVDFSGLLTVYKSPGIRKHVEYSLVLDCIPARRESRKHFSATRLASAPVARWSPRHCRPFMRCPLLFAHTRCDHRTDAVQWYFRVWAALFSVFDNDAALPVWRRIGIDRWPSISSLRAPRVCAPISLFPALPAASSAPRALYNSSPSLIPSVLGA